MLRPKAERSRGLLWRRSFDRRGLRWFSLRFDHLRLLLEIRRCMKSQPFGCILNWAWTPDDEPHWAIRIAAEFRAVTLP
jgi:hypothetical protein